MIYIKLQQYLIERVDSRGFFEQIIYTGPVSQKPKGWKIVKKVT